MRYGYWLPVFGGWLRNVDDEQMAADVGVREDAGAAAARRSGYDLTLVAELNLNDIKGVEAPSLDAWSTAAALAAVTSTLELMVAVRPTFHNPALLAKQAANIDHIGGGPAVAERGLVVVGGGGDGSTASSSTSTTTATPARPSGSSVVDGLWRETDVLVRGPASTTSQDAVLSRSRSAGRGRRSTPAASRRPPRT